MLGKIISYLGEKNASGSRQMYRVVRFLRLTLQALMAIVIEYLFVMNKNGEFLHKIGVLMTGCPRSIKKQCGGTYTDWPIEG